MKADIRIRPLIKMIPSFRGTIERHNKYWFKYSLYLDWLTVSIDVDNF